MSLLDKILGPPLASYEEEEQKVGVLQGIPMLGLDALGSAAYGPEAALTLLLPAGALGLRYIGPITGIILLLLAILYFSYRQTIAAYPNGGGSYTVARENLGVRMGLLAAAALMLDYLLNVAVGISAGVGALVSAVPSLHSHILMLCLGILLLITIVNLRGIRESGAAWLVPTYLFVGSLGLVLGFGVARALMSGGHPRPVVPPPALPAATTSISLWLLLRAFASGCTAMTGVEAVSNGVTAFAEPATRGARRTLAAICAILALLLAGIAYLSHTYHIGATDPGAASYQSVISQVVGAVVGRGFWYYVTLGSTLAVLCLSANTSFADFPRLCHLLAEDDFLPHAFANRGRRLVYSLGIVILATLAGLLLVIFGGITDRLIPLFAVGAFLAFTLSQAGMVAHRRQQPGRGARASLLINAVGAVATGGALAVILAAKFLAGAWITLLLIPALLLLFTRVKRHYDHVAREIACPCPLSLDGRRPPMIAVPITGWNRITEKGLRFALQISPDVEVIHISTDDAKAAALRELWTECVEQPLRREGLPRPRLVFLPSPRRYLIGPLLRHLRALEAAHPDRPVAVIIPELVQTRWYQYLLHNHTAAVLKAALFFHGDRRLVVINVPWYLGEERAA